MRKWYSIRAAADDEAEILIYDEIGRDWFGDGIASDDFVRELADIDAATLNVRINSTGGQVFEGLAIYNALERHSARVVVHVDSIAASIASVIAMAGDEIRVAENAFLMIHDPWGGVIGNAAEMRKMADELEKVGGSLAGTYARRTGQDEADVLAWMSAETWYDASEAVEAGFADEITTKKTVRASLDLSRFGNVPTKVRALAARMATADPPTPEPEPEPEPRDFSALAAESEYVLASTRL